MIWVAAGLAAIASLLRWAVTDTQAHAWSADALGALAAASLHMMLAVLLVGRPPGTERVVYLGGALVSAAILLAFLPGLVPGAASAEPHGGHGGGSTAGIETLDALRLGIEVALIGVLGMLYLGSRREGPSPAD